MNKKRNLIVSLLLVLSLAFTAATYAYWSSTVNVTQAPDSAENIEVGVGESASTTVLVTPTEDNGVLVPSGKAQGTQVEELTYTFEVIWEATDVDASGALGTLSVVASANHALFNVSTVYDSNIVAGGSAVLVTVTVTLTEPANQIEYDEVAGNNFTLTVTFDVVPN